MTARTLMGPLSGLALALALGARCGTEPSTDDTAPGTQDDLRVGLRHFSGLATVEGAYEGWEAFHFTAEQGLGDDVCQVRYTLTSTAPRWDCADCVWAFDLESSAPNVEGEDGDGCEGLGITAADFDGLSYSYGFAETTDAYSSVLMYQVEGYGWYPVSFATWQDPRFQYDWEMGLYYY